MWCVSLNSRLKGLLGTVSREMKMEKKKKTKKKKKKKMMKKSSTDGKRFCANDSFGSE